MSRRETWPRPALLPLAALLLASGCAVPATRLDPADDATWTTLNDRASRYPTAAAQQ